MVGENGTVPFTQAKAKIRQAGESYSDPAVFATPQFGPGAFPFLRACISAFFARSRSWQPAAQA
jgi:hypothetical protein